MHKIGRRASYFKQARKNRLLEIAEDYTELIADYLHVKGHIRVRDIAREMGVSHVSVVRTIKKLIRDGYLIENAESIALTEKGKEMAAFSKKKHLVLTEFLLALGIPEHVVATDVEGIEHHISPDTLKALTSYLNRHFQR